MMEFEIQSCSSEILSKEDIEQMLANEITGESSRRHLTRRVSDVLKNMKSDGKRRLSTYSPRARGKCRFYCNSVHSINYCNLILFTSNSLGRGILLHRFLQNGTRRSLRNKLSNQFRQ